MKLNLGRDLYLKGRIGWKGLSKDEYLTNSDYKIINATALMDGYVDWNNCGFITKDRYEESPEIMLQEGDILISKDGTLGKIGYVKGLTTPCTVASGIFVLRNSIPEKLNFDYLYHVLKSNIFKDFIQRNKSLGSTILHLYQRDLENFELELPSMEHQRSISGILNAIEDKIANNNKINAELESLAKTIYDYWFLQFEFPNEEGKPYKSSGGKMVWNEELKREIPEGWKLGVISDFIKEEKGGDWGKESQDEKYKIKVNCIRGADFPAMTGNENLKAPTRFILEKNKYKVLSDGDVIVEISGGSPTQSTGRICYINSNTLNRFSCDVITSNFCKAFSLKNKSYLYWFYLMWQKLLVSNVFFNFEGKTTGIKNLQFDVLTKGYKICIPPEQLITKFHNAVENLYLKIQKNQENNQELSSLRDFLLPMLMNGQISFSDDI